MSTTVLTSPHDLTVARVRLTVAELALDRALSAWRREQTDATAISVDSALLTLAAARAAFASPCVGPSLWDYCEQHDTVHHEDVACDSWDGWDY